ncbi:MAG: tRNA (adenosine(37)-N6)-threonylcarbamoyltransferase complex ATPase subunit type 1 TsaE [Oscillospiraceae bacterium]|nr:tRNA (adenosine(37)-N6)-threonylcarbamoyltransferase complex ATPase subunit type 1 TsaE [Oscillospiraceae bacterium]
MEVFVSNSERETEQFAESFAKRLSRGSVIAFEGTLGAGKTAFTRGLARGLNSRDSVSSPTFAIVNEYDGEIPLFHFDMYRIETLGELYSIGFFEYLERGGICAIEWSENIYSALPEETVFVSIEQISQSQRKITVREGKE